jgi:molybdenum cofactor guanylyltransferase
MGSDKALLPFGSRNLLELALCKAKEVSPLPLIVGARERYAAFGDVVEDRIPGCGPLGGIHTALCATRTDVNLVLSVDMPLMTAGFLQWMVLAAVSRKELAIVPEAEERVQPLCAIYKRAALCVIEQALNSGDFKVGHIFARLPTHYISETELRSAGFSPDIFRNINTPAEYEAVANLRTPVPWQATKGQSS